jgi:3,4-dihydroxy 2-butanone 4-phosphate synthase/GTP cyclohydrolase II
MATTERIAIDPIEKAIDDIRQGKMIIVVDDEDRENEGDFVMAARHATPEAINFMATHGRGLICVPLEEQRCADLHLTQMVTNNTDNHQTAFTVTVDHVQTSTGISAADRALTIRALIEPAAQPADFRKPGHIFPLRAKPGGVLRRAGHTEAGTDLARIAGFEPAAVIVEIMNADGTMARLPQLREVADRFGLSLVTIEDLIKYRISTESLIRRAAVVEMPTEYGDFQLIAYENTQDNETHLALVKGTWEPGEPVLTRVHSSCVTGDIFGSCRCDCGPQLHSAMQMVEREGKGVILYMHQEGRGIGLLNKLRAYKLQEQGMDTVEANEALGFKPDQRDYGVGAQILRDLGVRKLRLMTNNPKKRAGLIGYGLEIVENVPIEIEANDHNRRYLTTKREKMGHLLHL